MLTNIRLFCMFALLFGSLIAFLVFICEGIHWESYRQQDLRLVIVVHRHGERTPTQFYKNDPYSNVEKYWPQGLGQLTLKGKSQMYNVGKFMKQRYSNFISNFTVDSVRVFSSDADRCLMSSGTLLAGMFPPTEDQLWTEELSWQPIPIHTMPPTMDSINGKAKCPKFEQEYSKIEKEMNANYSQSLESVYSFVTTHSGSNVSTVNSVRKLYSTLRCEEVNGYALPPWTKVVYPHQLKEISKLSIASNTWTDSLKRLRGGPLLKDILKNLELIASGESKKKVIFYSIHDTGVVSLYRTLGFDRMILPDYGTTFIFELLYANQQYFVVMFLLANTYNENLIELKFPYCEMPCPLEKLLEATKTVVPQNWEKECQIAV